MPRLKMDEHLKSRAEEARIAEKAISDSVQVARPAIVP